MHEFNTKQPARNRDANMYLRIRANQCIILFMAVPPTKYVNYKTYLKVFRHDASVIPPINGLNIRSFQCTMEWIFALLAQWHSLVSAIARIFPINSAKTAIYLPSLMLPRCSRVNLFMRGIVDNGNVNFVYLHQALRLLRLRWFGNHGAIRGSRRIILICMRRWA